MMKRKCPRHPKTWMYFSPDEGYECPHCIQDDRNHAISIYYCSHCGTKGNLEHDDGDLGYWEFTCTKCYMMTRAYYPVQEEEEY